MRRTSVVLVVIGPLELVSNHLKNHVQKLGRRRILHKTAKLVTARPVSLQKF